MVGHESQTVALGGECATLHTRSECQATVNLHSEMWNARRLLTWGIWLKFSFWENLKTGRKKMPPLCSGPYHQAMSSDAVLFLLKWMLSGLQLHSRTYKTGFSVTWELLTFVSPFLWSKSVFCGFWYSLEYCVTHWQSHLPWFKDMVANGIQGTSVAWYHPVWASQGLLP